MPTVVEHSPMPNHQRAVPDRTVTTAPPTAARPATPPRTPKEAAMIHPQPASPAPVGQSRSVSTLAQSPADRVRSLLQSADRPLIMGILNVTADSFSDGGRYDDAARAVAHGCQLAAEGADIIDIGGESTRPGSHAPSVEDELNRVIPVIHALSSRLTTALSIDTSRPQVMRAAVAAGAAIINDVRALTEPGALTAAADLAVPVCLVHMQGSPATMQDNPHYTDVTAEVRDYLVQRLQACRDAGIPHHDLVVDPGFGFGKSPQHNLTLLAQLNTLRTLHSPVLVGLSRKGMLGHLTGRRADDRLAASLAAVVLAVQRGAGIVRVHDVAATRDALAVLRALTQDNR